MARRKTKRLLSEGEMRRFMKLAKISPMNEMGGYDMAPGQRDEEEEMEMGGEEMDVSADEMEMGDEEVPMDDMPEEPAMDDMEMDMEPAGEAGMVDVEQFMSALEDALEEVTGKPVSAVVDEPGDEGAPPKGGDDTPVEMSPEPVEDEMGMDMMDDEEEEEEEEEEVDDLAEAIARRVRRKLAESRRPAKRRTNSRKRAMSKKQTVDRVANRVTKRLQEEKKAKKALDKRADELTDRIFKRLMKESR